MSSKNPEFSNNDLENQVKNTKEIKDSLVDFGKNPDNDKKFLENPKSGENSVNAIKGDIDEKTKSIKNPENKAKIDEKIKGLEKYSKLGKLNPEQAQELSNVYKEIASIQGTEVKEDNIQGEEVHKSIEAKNEDYSKKLLDAVERLDKLLANHSEEAQKKVENDINKSKQAREIPGEEPPSLDDFPSPLKESPTV